MVVYACLMVSYSLNSFGHGIIPKRTTLDAQLISRQLDEHTQLSIVNDARCIEGLSKHVSAMVNAYRAYRDGC